MSRPQHLWEGMLMVIGATGGALGGWPFVAGMAGGILIGHAWLFVRDRRRSRR